MLSETLLPSEEQMHSWRYRDLQVEQNVKRWLKSNAKGSNRKNLIGGVRSEILACVVKTSVQIH